MATYYIRKTGSDAAAGTSGGAAWQTIGKALASGSTVAAGDTVYIGAGVYREVVTVAISGTAGNIISIIGDVDGSKTGDVGEVQWTAYTTNDSTAPSASAVATVTSRSYLSFSNLVIVGGGTASCVNGASGVHDLTFTDCAIVNSVAGGGAIQLVADAGVVLNLTVDRCLCWSNVSACVNLTTTSIGSGADWDNTTVIRNSLVWSVASNAVTFQATGGLSKHGGGLRVRDCTLVGATGVNANNTGLSTSIPCQIQDSLIIASTGLVGTAGGVLTEDHNVIMANTVRTNVTAGTGSISDKSIAPLLHIGQETKWGGLLRPLFMPTSGSKILGFGSAASAPSVDGLNRPRPAGGASTSNAAGYLERHDTAAKETSTVDAGTTGMKITGPGDQDIRIPVDATSTTITVRVRYDTNHAATNKPQAILQANGEIGVATETKTATVTTDTWETLTFSAITPTAKGWVTVRLVSRSAAGNGIAYFDTVTVT